MSDDRRLYLHDSKRNSRSDVDWLTHTKQLLNLLCIVYSFLKGALTWYGKLAWESDQAWNLIIEYFNCLGYDIYIYGAFEFLCNSITYV